MHSLGENGHRVGLREAINQDGPFFRMGQGSDGGMLPFVGELSVDLIAYEV